MRHAFQHAGRKGHQQRKQPWHGNIKRATVNQVDARTCGIELVVVVLLGIANHALRNRFAVKTPSARKLAPSPAFLKNITSSVAPAAAWWKELGVSGVGIVAHHQHLFLHHVGGPHLKPIGHTWYKGNKEPVCQGLTSFPVKSLLFTWHSNPFQLLREDLWLRHIFTEETWKL